MNYADMTDEELDAAIAGVHGTPPLFRTRGALLAMQAERARRAPPPPPSTWSMPDNVNEGLDAAATEVTPDPAVKPRVIAPPTLSPKDAYRAALDEAGWDEDEAELIMGSEGRMPGAYARTPDPRHERQRAEEWHQREAGHAATEQYWRDAYGHNPQPSMGTTYTRDRGLTDFGGGQTAMVDGVEVPVFDLGDGRQRYRLGDVRRAQEAAAEARWLAGHREMVEGDIEKYGHYSLKDEDAKLTREQVQARQARRVAEKKAKDERAKWRQAQIDNARKPLTPFEQKEKERRETRATMAGLAGGSSGLRGGAGGNMGMFRALAMLGGVKPEEMDAQQQALMQNLPIDPHRAQMEAAHNAQLTQLGLRVATGRGFQPMSDAERNAVVTQTQNAQAQQSQSIAEDADSIVGEYADDIGWLNLLSRVTGGGVAGWDPTVLTVEEEEKAVRRLRAKYPHLTYEQALEHVVAAASNTTRQRAPRQAGPDAPQPAPAGGSSPVPAVPRAVGAGMSGAAAATGFGVPAAVVAAARALWPSN